MWHCSCRRGPCTTTHSPSALTRPQPDDDTTDIVNHLVYDSFGRITSQTDSGKEPFHTFTGRDRDPLTQLSYHRARWYDPHTGRWLSEDPIGFTAGDENLYRYVGNNGPNAVDPFGLATYQQLQRRAAELQAKIKAGLAELRMHEQAVQDRWQPGKYEAEQSLDWRAAKAQRERVHDELLILMMESKKLERQILAHPYQAVSKALGDLLAQHSNYEYAEPSGITKLLEKLIQDVAPGVQYRFSAGRNYYKNVF